MLNLFAHHNEVHTTQLNGLVIIVIVSVILLITAGIYLAFVRKRS